MYVGRSRNRLCLVCRFLGNLVRLSCLRGPGSWVKAAGEECLGGRVLCL